MKLSSKLSVSKSKISSLDSQNNQSKNITLKTWDITLKTW